MFSLYCCCCFRRGWWSRHPQGDGLRHLREDPAERTALQRGPRHLCEPCGAVHPGSENCTFIFFLFYISIFLGCLHSLKFLSHRASSIISLRPVCPRFHLSSPSLYPLRCRSSPCRTGVWCAAVACLRCLMPTSLISRNCRSYKERSSSSTTCCW